MHQYSQLTIDKAQSIVRGKENFYTEKHLKESVGSFISIHFTYSFLLLQNSKSTIRLEFLGSELSTCQCGISTNYNSFKVLLAIIFADKMVMEY